MRIVIEGCDGSGKSTLIRRFQDRYPYAKLMKRPCSSEDGPIEELKEWVDSDLQPLKVPAPWGTWLYDRHPLVSELIYSPALGRPLARGFEDSYWLCRALEAFEGLGYRVIYCMPPKAEVKKNVEATHRVDTDHVRGVLANLDRIYDLYHIRSCIDYTKDYRWRWDYTIGDIDPLFGEFDQWLRGPM